MICGKFACNLFFPEATLNLSLIKDLRFLIPSLETRASQSVCRKKLDVHVLVGKVFVSFPLFVSIGLKLTDPNVVPT